MIPDRQQIIMNFSAPPSSDDLLVIAQEALEALPEELIEFCEDVTIHIEEFPDDVIVAEMELDDPYDLIALYRKGSELSPGVEKKIANDDDALIIYRRPFLDMWCETGEDVHVLIRQVMIEEIAQTFDFSEDEIEELGQRHYQGML